MPKINGDCNLKRVGREYRNLEAAFATKSDAGTLCTSLVRDVINNHINQMSNDGFMEKAWLDHRTSKSHDVECDDGSFSATKDGIDVLNIVNLGGIFIFHYIFIISVLFGTITIAQYKKRIKKKMENCNVDEEQTKEILDEQKTMEGLLEVMKGQATTLDGRLSNVEEHIISFDKRISSMENNVSTIIGLLTDKKNIQ